MGVDTGPEILQKTRHTTFDTKQNAGKKDAIGSDTISCRLQSYLNLI